MSDGFHDALPAVERPGPVSAGDRNRGPVRRAPTPTGIERLAEVLLRRKWWVILSIVFITLLAMILTSRQEKQYSATASLLFRDTSSQVLNSSGVIDPTRQGATNASLVALPALAD